MNQFSRNDTGRRSKKKLKYRWLLAAVPAAVAIAFLFWLNPPVLAPLISLYDLLTDRQRISDFVNTFGAAAPFVFMAMQFVQVILAPIPGEATGFIGGYLFGVFLGTVYSTLALTLGSIVNFYLGRILGKKWVRKMIPPVKLAKMDYLLRHQGVLLILSLFLFPGFPKDYLCLFLGISAIPLRVFLFIALIGRLPGTLMLNLQGALVFEKNYFILIVMMAIIIFLIFIGYLLRNKLYRWIKKNNGRSIDKIDEGPK